MTSPVNAGGTLSNGIEKQIRPEPKLAAAAGRIPESILQPGTPSAAWQRGERVRIKGSGKEGKIKRLSTQFGGHYYVELDDGTNGLWPKSEMERLGFSAAAKFGRSGENWWRTAPAAEKRDLIDLLQEDKKWLTVVWWALPAGLREKVKQVVEKWDAGKDEMQAAEPVRNEDGELEGPSAEEERAWNHREYDGAAAAGSIAEGVKRIGLMVRAHHGDYRRDQIEGLLVQNGYVKTPTEAKQAFDAAVSQGIAEEHGGKVYDAKPRSSFGAGSLLPMKQPKPARPTAFQASVDPMDDDGGEDRFERAWGGTLPGTKARILRSVGVSESETPSLTDRGFYGLPSGIIDKLKQYYLSHGRFTAALPLANSADWIVVYRKKSAPGWFKTEPLTHEAATRRAQQLRSDSNHLDVTVQSAGSMSASGSTAPANDPLKAAAPKRCGSCKTMSDKTVTAAEAGISPQQRQSYGLLPNSPVCATCLGQIVQDADFQARKPDVALADSSFEDGDVVEHIRGGKGGPGVVTEIDGSIYVRGNRNEVWVEFIPGQHTAVRTNELTKKAAFAAEQPNPLGPWWYRLTKMDRAIALDTAGIAREDVPALVQKPWPQLPQEVRTAVERAKRTTFAAEQPIRSAPKLAAGIGKGYTKNVEERWNELSVPFREKLLRENDVEPDDARSFSKVKWTAVPEWMRNDIERDWMGGKF